MSRPDAVEVLILASLYDFPTDRVCLELQRRGVRFARINRETLPDSKIRLDPIAPRLEIDTAGASWIVDDTIRSVLWRQPTFLRNAPGVALTVDEQLDRSQWSAFVRGLALFDSARWMNDPAATYRAEAKPWQLRHAARAGWPTPPSLITNDSQADFAAHLGRRVAVKPVDTVLLREGSTQHFAYTQLMDAAQLATEDLQAVPVIVQRALEGKTDIRVTVVEDHAWAVAIQRAGAGVEGDWRRQKKADLQYVDITLPGDVHDRCIALVRDMGLRFAGVDLVQQGDLFSFIEINPTGEWGWLDGPDRPIAAAIADALAA